MKTLLLTADNEPLCYLDGVASPDGTGFDLKAVLTFNDEGEARDFADEVGLDGFAPATLGDDTAAVFAAEAESVGLMSIRPELWGKVLVQTEGEPPYVWLGLHKPMNHLTVEEIEGSLR